MKEEQGGKIDPADELARRESELDRKEKEIKAEYDRFQGNDFGQLHSKDFERERENHELKLRELKTDVYKSKRTLKEMAEIVKRESAILQRTFRKKELEDAIDIRVINLQQAREIECLHVQWLAHLKEREDFCRERYAGDKSMLQPLLLDLREKIDFSPKG